MNSRNLLFLLGLLSLVAFPVAGEDRFITLSNLPMGTREKPLVLRTYFPDPGLTREVLSNHDLGYRARKYSPGKGDVDGFVDPILGIPGAIGVNFGPDLSICWDATECRLLYAWRGGFLDMTNYWGEPESGRRKGFGYIPELVGELIFVAKGSHPLGIFDQYTEILAPEFKGYRVIDGVPEFHYTVGEADVRVKIEPGTEPMSIVKHYTVKASGEVGYYETGYKIKKTDDKDGTFSVTIQGKPVVGMGGAAEEQEYSTEKPNVEWGAALYTNLGCLACHSTDGTRGHGPTFAGLYGEEVPITGMDEKVIADDAYIEESIVNPTAKVVESYPPGYMPPYPIGKKEIKSLTMFIKTLANE